MTAVDLHLTINGIVKKGYLAILALVTKDSAGDCGISLSFTNGCSKNKKNTEKKFV
jgi:hypothetical protein